MSPDKKPSLGSDWSRALRDTGPFLGLGLTLAGSVLLGIGGGYWIDSRLGTRPLFVLVGAVLGLGAAGYHFYKTVAGVKR